MRAVRDQAVFGIMAVFLYLGGFALAIEQKMPTGIVALISDLLPLAIAALSQPFSAPGFSACSAAKGAVEILTVYMAKELAARGITANTVAPGAIETDFLGGAVRDMPDLNRQFAGMIALGRVGVPD